MNLLKKYFGSETGTWWCRLGECLYIFSTSEMKEMDDRGEVSWVKPRENEDTILPICPYHGTLLSHAKESTVEVADGVTVIL